MTKRDLDQLFFGELRNTLIVEKLVLNVLEALPAGGSPAACLGRYIAQAKERIKRLDAYAPSETTANAGEPLTPSDIGPEIAALTGVGSHAGGEAALISVLHRVRRHFLARYAMLTSWSDLLGTPGPVPALMAALTEEMALLEASLDERPIEPATRGSSLGERLTALFDRKR